MFDENNEHRANIGQNEPPRRASFVQRRQQTKPGWMAYGFLLMLPNVRFVVVVVVVVVKAVIIRIQYTVFSPFVVQLCSYIGVKAVISIIIIIQPSPPAG